MPMVKRIYVEKKKGFDIAAKQACEANCTSPRLNALRKLPPARRAADSI